MYEYSVRATRACEIPAVKLAISAAGDRVAVGDSDGAVHVLDAATLKKVPLV